MLRYKVAIYEYTYGFERKQLRYAINEGIIDEGSTELDEEIIGNADLVIFALYPHVFVEWIENNQKLLKSGAIITDVTGVKRSIVYKIQDILRDDVEFIAAHPMAGREVSGVENSTDKMFQGANYIVTPTDKNTPEAINTCLELGRLLGLQTMFDIFSSYVLKVLDQLKLREGLNKKRL